MSNTPRPRRKEVMYSPFLKTTMFQADFPDEDHAFVIEVSRAYMRAPEDDVGAYKKLVTLHSGVPPETILKGRVGIDVIMLCDDAKRYIVCVDLRGVDYGHVQLYTFEKFDEGAADIDLSVLRTFEQIQSVMHHVTAAVTPSVVMRGGDSYATCPDVVDYTSPTGDKFVLSERTMQDCTNCSHNNAHTEYGKTKLSDGELTHLCYPCYATLGCVTADVRWNHVFGMPEIREHNICGPHLTPSQQYLSNRNQYMKCHGCRDMGITTRMYKSDTAPVFFCARCIPSAKGKYTFGHVFYVCPIQDAGLAGVMF